ncbi:LOW QUALITY PROTEIN: extensin [Drosophila obscura]|uniref:LOW QUALITY PROTEIN: extensin n=1 Tax=Drosophila obscura TaxID=7282 RepID=UPI001BB0F440|nr:LOW QUALITY PROTEIN: extensin [Drosophila obscura]
MCNLLWLTACFLALCLPCALSESNATHVSNHQTETETETKPESAPVPVPTAEKLIRYRRQPPYAVIKGPGKRSKQRRRNKGPPPSKLKYGPPAAPTFGHGHRHGYRHKPSFPSFPSSHVEEPSFSIDDFQHLKFEGGDFKLPTSSYEAQSMDLDFYSHHPEPEPVPDVYGAHKFPSLDFSLDSPHISSDSAYDHVPHQKYGVPPLQQSYQPADHSFVSHYEPPPPAPPSTRYGVPTAPAPVPSFTHPKHPPAPVPAHDSYSIYDQKIPNVGYHQHFAEPPKQKQKQKQKPQSQHPPVHSSNFEIAYSPPAFEISTSYQSNHHESYIPPHQSHEGSFAEPPVQQHPSNNYAQPPEHPSSSYVEPAEHPSSSYVQLPDHPSSGYVEPPSSSYVEPSQHPSPNYAQHPSNSYSQPDQHPPSSGYDQPPQHPPSSAYDHPPQHPPSSGYDQPPQHPPSSAYDHPPQHPPSSAYDHPPQHPPSSAYDHPPQHPPSSGYDQPPQHPPSFDYPSHNYAQPEPQPDHPSQSYPQEDYSPPSEELPLNPHHKFPSFDFPKSSYEVPIYDPIPFEASTKEEQQEAYPPILSDNSPVPVPNDIAEDDAYAAGSSKSTTKRRKRKRVPNKHTLDVPELQQAYDSDRHLREDQADADAAAHGSHYVERKQTFGNFVTPTTSTTTTPSPWSPMLRQRTTSSTAFIPTIVTSTPATRTTTHTRGRNRGSSRYRSTQSPEPISTSVTIEKSHSKSYYDGTIAPPIPQQVSTYGGRGTRPTRPASYAALQPAAANQRTTKGVFDTTLFKSPHSDREMERNRNIHVLRQNLPKNHKLY